MGPKGRDRRARSLFTILFQPRPLMVLDGPVGPAALAVACLDCARFDAADPLAVIAAVSSSAPYAMVLGLAAVS